MRKINFRAIFFSFIAIFLGISFSRQLLLANWIYITLSAIMVLATLILCLHFKVFKRFVLLLFCFVLGVCLFVADYYNFVGKDYGNEVYVVTGRVCEVDGTKMVVENAKVGANSNRNIIVYTSSYSFASVGDTITFESTIKQNSLFELATFKSWLYRDNCSHRCYVDSENIVLIDGKMHYDEELKQAVKNKLNNFMTEDNSSIAYAMIFGDTSEIDLDIISAYRTTGIAHLLAVSGLHVGFLGAIIFFLLKLLKMKGWLRFLILFVILGLYCFLCGFTPSVIRASLMLLVLCSAELFGRKYDSLTAVGLVGLLILLFKPMFALDIGFRLSFFCVISIFVLYRPISKMFRKIKLPRWLCSALALTLATQIGILPFTICSFGEIPTLATIMNIVSIPIFQFAYTITLIGLPFVFAWSGFGFIFVFSSYLIQFISSLALWLANLPFSSIKFSKNNLALIFGFYIVVFVSSRFFNYQTNKKIFLLSGLLTITLVLSLLFTINFDNNNKFYTLQTYGPVYVIQNNQTATAFVDCNNYNNLEKFLINNNIKLDLLIVKNKTENTDAFLASNKVQKVIELSKISSFENSKINIQTINLINRINGYLIQFDNTKFLFTKTELTEWEQIAFEQSHYNADFIIDSTNTWLQQKLLNKPDEMSLFLQIGSENWTFDFENDKIISARSID